MSITIYAGIAVRNLFKPLGRHIRGLFGRHHDDGIAS